ncbi:MULTISPECIES: hypothetical protein [unclassified Halobellus]|uniref:hypothetical protein n=1 Tax=unclassified Halobellus TaxID=2638438 RepID=UPI000EF224D9|nr:MULTISPECIES: hypothetical protein [unclassified Halobellus]MDQ2055913.1 hypothetical protein [Halobellus sp. H-GB7]RLM87914.1 hypothetical protein D3D02_13300 [Halobellus sp. Atlit-38R]
MVLALHHAKLEPVSRFFGALSVFAASVAAGWLWSPHPFRDVFFSGIVLLAVLFSLLGMFGVWTNHTPIAWMASLLLLGFTVFGMWSAGLLFVPAAIFLVIATIASHRTGPRRTVQHAIRANPPTVAELVLKAVAGASAGFAGVWITYFGAVRQELFGACADETLSCALTKMHWGAVGLTLFGLATIAVGGWALWKQIYIARVLRLTRSG